jgi:PTS system ascorbate-specific IIC component
MKVLDFIVNQVLREPSIFLSIVVLLGMIFLKKKGSAILVSTLKTMVGVRVLQIGTGLLSSSSKPMLSMLVARFGLQGRVADPWSGVAEGLERMADVPLAGQIGLILLLAWLLHLLFSRFTPLKVVFLTGHTAFTDTVVITFSVYAISGWSDWRAIALSVILLAVYWWLFPALMAKPLKKLVGDDNITIGHNMAAFGWVAMLIAKWTGDPKNDTEKLVLPGWLNVMKDSVISYSVIMAFLYTLIGILSGPRAAADYTGGMNYILFSFMQGINIAVGVTILLLGVRMFLAELLPAFQGFAKVVVPGAIPAVDNPVFWTYAPQATLLGLIFTVVG